MNEHMEKLQTELEVKITENSETFIGTGIIQHGLFKISKTLAVPVSENLEDNKPKESGKFPCREAVGSQMYLYKRTRPDITYAVNMASRKTTNSTIGDVQSTQNLGLRYSSQDNITVIDAYNDADYASDTFRRSTSGTSSRMQEAQFHGPQNANL
ncbi:hypothetical protein PR048_001783 [Dryococelus australis]|uniref:Uncharacterized protein n=1 Tax=Dryococelus australis TaxID=614101 RepID=A0ABQ9IJP7_9NEOP|nr:hypothetical protein PR048_001783 [Dryococelus australis]